MTFYYSAASRTSFYHGVAWGLGIAALLVVLYLLGVFDWTRTTLVPMWDLR